MILNFFYSRTDLRSSPNLMVPHSLHVSTSSQTVNSKEIITTKSQLDHVEKITIEPSSQQQTRRLFIHMLDRLPKYSILR